MRALLKKVKNPYTNKRNRFGAVLDRDAFEDAVYEAFVVGRVF